MPSKIITAVCAHCGTAYPASKYHVEKRGGKYCSHACWANATRVADSERFERFADRSGWPRACHLYTGGKLPGGYGVFRLTRPERCSIGAHRYAWLLAHPGETIPDGMDVCHACDNPSCVNPAHLFLGTRKDNMRDCKAKNRHNAGTRNGSAKLTPEEVREIRRLHAEGTPQSHLAQRFGVSKANMFRIVHGLLWSEI